MIRGKVRVMATIGIGLLSVVFVTGASAQSFHFTKTGKITQRARNVQVFTTGVGKIECKKATGVGSVTALLALHILLIVTFSECTAFGLGGVDVSPAQILKSADGLLAIENTVVVTSLLGGCSVKLGPQDLVKEKYKNSGKIIIEESELSGISSTGSGGICGGSNTTGTYSGNSEVELEGGEVSWS